MAVVRERWLSRRAVSLHVAVLVFVPGCAVAAWWQINRAEGGNQLSYLYSVMWPVFGILGLYFWWMLLHTDYDTVGLKGMRRQQEAAAADDPGTVAGSTPDPDTQPTAPASGRRLRRRGPGAGGLQRAAGRARLQGAQDMAGPREGRRPAGAMKRLTQRGMRGALFRYQLMANIVGVLIIPLFIFTGLHIAKVGGFKIELAIFGVGHGYLYIVYLITAGFLALKARLHIPWILLMFAAGLVPGLTFLTEWIIVTKKIQPLIAAQEAAAAAETSGVSPAAL